MYEYIVSAWNAQADEHNQYDTLSDRERIEFALSLAKQPRPTAKEQYDKFTEGEAISDPIEALRYFCAQAMTGQDWIDVEPFIDAISAERSALSLAGRVEKQEPVAEVVEYFPFGPFKPQGTTIQRLKPLSAGTKLYTAPQPCPECEKLKAERDRLQPDVARVYMEVTGGLCSKENTPASVVISLFEDYLSKRVDEEVSDVVKERNELAAQVEKIRIALSSCQTWQEIKEFGPSIWHRNYNETLVKEALALPDLSTGILNRVRAETAERCAKVCDVHARGWHANPGENPMAGFVASSNCATDIRALAADMEAGK